MNEEKTVSLMNELKEIKCFTCEYTPCIDLSRKKSNEEGGEFVVLLTAMKEEEKILYCVNGNLLYCLCKTLVSEINENDEDDGENFCLYVGWECIRDLKASLMLAFLGHHGPSMQVLRTCMEIWLYGLYFQRALLNAYKQEKNQGEIEKVKRIFQKWVNKEELRESIGKIINYLTSMSVITGKERDILHEMYRDLCYHIHSIKYTPAGRLYFDEECERDGDVACGASAIFNKENFSDWSRRYQEICAFIFQSYLRLFPDLQNNPEVQEIFRKLRIPFDVDKEYDRSLQLITSKSLQKFIAKKCKQLPGE